MKTKYYISALLIVLLGACAQPAYLPAPKNININERGAYIRIKDTAKLHYSGELIALDSVNMIVLMSDSEQCEILPINSISKFTLRYAKAKNYSWTVPASLLSVFFHGYFGVYTIPANLIVTVSASITGDQTFTYKNKDISYKELRMFARFPQGVPPDIELSSIK